MADDTKSLPTALDILIRLYAAEQVYIVTTPDQRDFSGMAAVLVSDAKLHQSPDLPYGGTYFGHDGYVKWAEAMAEESHSLRGDRLGW